MTTTGKHTAGPTTAAGARTQAEQFLLEWLGKSEFSQYGECHGSVLDALVRNGLAQIHEGREGQSGFIAQGDSEVYRAVSLTDAGRAALSKAKGG